MNRTVLCGLLLGLVLLRESAHAGPVCALVDTAKLPVSALLEARLLAAEDTTWVERTEIERLLGERELQAAFGADGVRSRASLGEIIKADILVLLRTAKNPVAGGPPLIDCVVCETKHGLRLRTATFDKNQEALAAAMEAFVKEGLKKYEEKVETIVAVPPFLSDDLGLERNYLQTAYAKLVEQSLLSQPGLLVVELGEAQAIAKELAIEGADRVIQPSKPPLYVVGRYRHETVGKEEMLQMSLRLMQGERQVRLQGVQAWPKSDGPAWIMRTSGEFLKTLLAAPPAGEFSAAAEAKAIAERGRMFQKIGNWAEAHALFEASLLLDPEAEWVRRDAIMAITSQIIPALSIVRDKATSLRVIALGNRGMEHLERFLSTAGEISKYQLVKEGGDFAYQFLWALRASETVDSATPAELRELLDRTRRDHVERLLRLSYLRAKMGRVDRTHPDGWHIRAMLFLPDKQRYSYILRAADDWRDLPDLGRRLQDMTAYYPDDTPELHDFLSQLDKSDRPELRQVGVNVRKRFEEGREEKARVKLKRPPPEPTDIDPRLQNLTLRSEVKYLPQFHECVPLGEAGDLYWSGGQILLMSRPGEVAYYPPTADLKMTFASDVVYDGKYVWVAGKREPSTPVLLAIDALGKRIEFSAEDGLPRLDHMHNVIRLAVIAPGKVGVIGYSGRTWLALAETDGTKRKFDLFFEAREVVTETDESHRTNTKLAFRPTRIFTIHAPDGDGCRILIGRQVNSIIAAPRPLVLDPATKAVSVSDFGVNSWEGGRERLVTASRDSLYFYEHKTPKSPTLKRVPFPCVASEDCIVECPEGWLTFDRNGLNIISNKWWLVDPVAGTVKPHVERTAWFYSHMFATSLGDRVDTFKVDLNQTTMINKIFSTGHYGPVLRLTKGGKERLMWLNSPTPAE